MENSWKKIAPFWPLKNLVSINPLSGFEELHFKDALLQAQIYFQQKDFPLKLREINRQSIKWLKVFFDNGGCVIPMPLKDEGLLKSVLTLLQFDNDIGISGREKAQSFQKYINSPVSLISELLNLLHIEDKDHEIFLILMITTLKGWSSHVQYLAIFEGDESIRDEYLAFRLLLTFLIWPEAKNLLEWHNEKVRRANVDELYKEITNNEKSYIESLQEKLKQNFSLCKKDQRKDAQFIFCVDVREEKFRRKIESLGNYETFSCAGFFGLPVTVENSVTGQSHASCPYIIRPSYKVYESPKSNACYHRKFHNILLNVKKLCDTIDRNLLTHFPFSALMGVVSALWMWLKTFAPALSCKIKDTINPKYHLSPSINSIPTDMQVEYTYNLLKTMGLTDNFAPIVVFCGHRSRAENNAHISALHCAACGAHHGGANARILVAILNRDEVRTRLSKLGVKIQPETRFIAAEHNTATDELEFFDQDDIEGIDHIKNITSVVQKKDFRGFMDWATTFPERGLYGNASFIIGPRYITENIDLEGRAFLHSYDFTKDKDGSCLGGILTRSMRVIKAINTQYFFSSMDNDAFGSGSITRENVIGEMGVMQGAASDLTTGLPIEFISKHQLLRLTIVIYAPEDFVSKIIEKHDILRTLVKNEWVHIICLDTTV